MMIKFIMMPIITSNDNNTNVFSIQCTAIISIIIIEDPKSVSNNYLKMKVFQDREKP